MFKPLLAPREEPMSFARYWDFISYPILGSPKLDGIRGYTEDGCVKSRTGKLLPSAQLQDMFGKFSFLDGEFHVGSACEPNVYNLTQSHVMAYSKPADNLMYSVFDYVHPEMLECCYEERLNCLKIYVDQIIRENPEMRSHISIVEQCEINSYEELIAYESKCIGDGFEGIMLRSAEGRYKQGRATIRDNIIFKLKRFADDEGVIVDILPRMHNTNEKKLDEQGNSKRSQAKEGLIETDIAGKFVVHFNGMNIEVAPGQFNHEQLTRIYADKDKYIGQLIKFRHFPYGVKDKPRFPRAVGFRDTIDI